MTRAQRLEQVSDCLLESGIEWFNTQTSEDIAAIEYDVEKGFWDREVGVIASEIAIPLGIYLYYQSGLLPRYKRGISLKYFAANFEDILNSDYFSGRGTPALPVGVVMAYLGHFEKLLVSP